MIRQIVIAALATLLVPAAADAQDSKNGVTTYTTAKTQPAPLVPAVASTAATAAETQILARLPIIPKSKEGVPLPSLSEVQSWPTQQRASYVNQAQVRATEMETAVTSAQDLLKSARNVTRTLVPNARNYGEGEDAYKQRYATSKARVDAALAPYEQNLALKQQALSDARAILSGCQNAAQGLEGGWTVIGR
jgi:hypothetical protein